MLQLVRSREQVDPEWDAFVASCPGGHHVQTAMWSRVKATVRWRVTRLVLRRGGEIVGGCQVLWRSLLPGMRVGYVPRGPLCADPDPAALEALLDGLDGECGARGLGYLKVQPPTDRHDLGLLLDERGYVPGELDVGPAVSVRVDLSRSPEELIAGLSPRTRRNVRQSEREGLVVREGDERDLPTFCQIVAQTARRQGFRTYPSAYWEAVWRELSPGGHAHLMLAELDGRVLTAVLVIAFNDTVLYKMGGWTGERTQARPNESAHWAAILWARKAGYRWYDLEGIPGAVGRAIASGVEPPQPLPGPVAFKLGFGGTPVIYPGTYDRAPQRAMAFLGRWGAPLRASHPIVGRMVGRRT